MAVDATFNDISIRSWRSVLLMVKTTALPQFTDKFVSSTPHLIMVRTHNVSGDRYELHK